MICSNSDCKLIQIIWINKSKNSKKWGYSGTTTEFQVQKNVRYFELFEEDQILSIKGYLSVN